MHIYCSTEEGNYLHIKNISIDRFKKFLPLMAKKQKHIDGDKIIYSGVLEFENLSITIFTEKREATKCKK